MRAAAGYISGLNTVTFPARALLSRRVLTVYCPQLLQTPGAEVVDLAALVAGQRRPLGRLPLTGGGLLGQPPDVVAARVAD